MAQSQVRQGDAAFSEGVDYRTTESGCWEWLRASNGAGYGTVYLRGGESLAHRASYVAAYGPIPDDRNHIHHRCENKLCVNPLHLEALSSSEHKSLHMRAASTLTWDDVRAIREANRAGVGIYELADTYGLSTGTLHPLILNRTWIDPDYEPGVDRDCEECESTFRTTKVNKRFCSTYCRSKWNSRRTKRRQAGTDLDRPVLRRAA